MQEDWEGSLDHLFENMITDLANLQPNNTKSFIEQWYDVLKKVWRLYKYNYFGTKETSNLKIGSNKRSKNESSTVSAEEMNRGSVG